MAIMLNVYDRQTRKKTAVLQNAFDIVETQEINQIYSMTFTLPAEDEKNGYCLPRHYIRYGDNGQLYRIKSPKVNENNASTITYECEHVITTLCDDIMFGSFNYGGKGVYTTATINWILSQQKTKNWKLGTCAFSRQYEYNWEQENLLNALYSIPKEFAASYMWTFDTVNYPWTLNLVAIDKNATPGYYLRAKSNILSSGTSADYANICTRIYPLGYGEGVNQLTIRDATVSNITYADDGKTAINGNPVNSGGEKYNNTFIQSPQSYIDKYGIVEKVLVDRRFEHANTLFGYAKSMLDIYQEPTMSRTFDVTDLYPITNKPLDDAQVGKICKMTQDGSIAYITKTQRKLDVVGDLQIDLSTKASDIVSNVADLADRIRIESVYAQGATQLYQHSKDANAAPQKGKGMVLSLYFPKEMKQINKVLLKLDLKKFRYYGENTASGGGITANDNVNTQLGFRHTKDNPINTVSGGAIEADANKTTELGGAINTQAQVGGNVTGQTGVGGGGGNITLKPSISVSINDTGNADWSPKLESGSSIFETGVPSTVSNNTYLTSVNGGHSHTVSGSTNEVTPAESADYKHSHSFNGTMASTSEDGRHQHETPLVSHRHNINYFGLVHKHSVNASASVSIGNVNGYTGFSHSHSFSVPGHTHNIIIPAHSHQLILAGHTHQIIISPHTHAITPGIFENSATPTKFDIYVGNSQTPKVTVNAKSYNGDIAEWLLNDNKMIPRDTWINIEIVPDQLAYVVSSVFVQGFVQSRGGGNY